MPKSSFFMKSVPDEDIKSLVITGGYSHYYATQDPGIKLSYGDWKTRYCTLADSFEPVMDRVHNFEVRADDVWIVTSTKCGTTWSQEMTWLLLNSFDYKKAKEIDLTLRSPFLEFNGVVPNVPFDTIDASNKLSSPRLIKSHLPIWLLPKQLWTKKPKIIYVFRNPKDAAISYYHHWRGMVGFKGTKEEFMRFYIDSNVNFNPFWPHVIDFWQLRNEPNIFFTSYERMKRDLAGVIKDVCRFLQRDITEDQLLKLVNHLSFDNMKNNSSCNHEKEFKSMQDASGVKGEEFRFVRRGEVGSHKDELDADIIQEFDDWNEENLRPYNLTIENIVNYSKY